MVACRSPCYADIQLQMMPVSVVHQHLLHTGESGVFTPVQPHQHTPTTQLQRRQQEGDGHRMKN